MYTSDICHCECGTYITLQRECIGILDIFILEIIKVNLCKVGINSDGVMITNTGQPVIVHCCCRTENIHVNSEEDEKSILVFEKVDCFGDYFKFEIGKILVADNIIERNTAPHLCFIRYMGLEQRN